MAVTPPPPSRRASEGLLGLGRQPGVLGSGACLDHRRLTQEEMGRLPRKVATICWKRTNKGLGLAEHGVQFRKGLLTSTPTSRPRCPSWWLGGPRLIQ